MAERHPAPGHGFAPRGGRFPVRRAARGRGPARADAGVVTAEFAIALPTVLLVLATLLAAATVALNHLRCIDAARSAARAAARNDPAADVVAIARAVGPPGAQVASGSQGGRVVVTVSAPVTLRLPGSPTVWVSSTAVGLREVEGELPQGAGVVSATALQAAGAARRRRRRSAGRRHRGSAWHGRRRRGTRHGLPPHPPDVDDERCPEPGPGQRWRGTRHGPPHPPADDAGRHPEPGPRQCWRGTRHRSPQRREDGAGRHPEPGPGQRRRGGGDRGAGAVLAIGLMGVVLGLTALLSSLGHVVSARHQAAGAADLAALAAAQTAAGTSVAGPGAGPCAVAARIASANRGQLASCSLDAGGTAAVSVSVRTRYGFAVRTTARAGPATPREHR